MREILANQGTSSDSKVKKKFWTPELLSPAGSLQKLKVAISYGADAVYVGGLKFGLRAAAENFTREQLREGVSFAHKRGSQVFVVINAFPFDSDLEELPSFIRFLSEIKVDALIVSDLGSLSVIKTTSDIPIHVSTQASVLNVQSANFWKNMGSSRVILGREVSIEEALKIKNETSLEVEQFIHGSMCMAYSGNCTISNFTQGRDSNRGGCSHSCRFKYELETHESEKFSDFFMSSKDLEGIDLLPHFLNAKIDSLKIEGRMKGPIYAATVTRAYRRALDFYAENGFFSKEVLATAKSEVKKITHREYFSGSLDSRAGSDSVFDEREHKDSDYNVLGSIIDINNEYAFVRTKSKVFKSTVVEVLPFQGEAMSYLLEDISLLGGDSKEYTSPDQILKIPFARGMEVDNLVRFEKTCTP